MTQHKFVFYFFFLSAYLMYNQGTMEVYTIRTSHTSLERTSGNIYMTRALHGYLANFGLIAAEWLAVVA
jgi:hypothetical protein